MEHWKVDVYFQILIESFKGMGNFHRRLAKKKKLRNLCGCVREHRCGFMKRTISFGSEMFFMYLVVKPCILLAGGLMCHEHLTCFL